MQDQDLFSRLAENLTGRLHGPLQFRLLIQPLVATVLAIKSGLADARTGQPAYFWSLFTDPANRAARLREGFKAVLKLFIVACILDVVYQLIVLKRVYPGETILVALVLAFIPYLLIRGPANRIARLFRSGSSKGA
jgi:hypothetical protein